jgi:hypothetical protein
LKGSPTGTMHHVDVTPSAADVARPSAPSDVTVALETRAGCLRAYHRRPARPGGRATLLSPQTATATPGTHPRTAGRPSRAGNEIRVDLHHRPAGVDHRTHPRHRAAGRQRVDHHSWTGQGPTRRPSLARHDHRGTLDRWRYHHPAPVTPPTTTTAPTTTAAPTTTLATPTSTPSHHRAGDPLIP